MLATQSSSELEKGLSRKESSDSLMDDLLSAASFARRIQNINLMASSNSKATHRSYTQTQTSFQRSSIQTLDSTDSTAPSLLSSCSTPTPAPELQANSTFNKRDTPRLMKDQYRRPSLAPALSPKSHLAHLSLSSMLHNTDVASLQAGFVRTRCDKHGLLHSLGSSSTATLHFALLHNGALLLYNTTRAAAALGIQESSIACNHGPRYLREAIAIRLAYEGDSLAFGRMVGLGSTPAACLRLNRFSRAHVSAHGFYVLVVSGLAGVYEHADTKTWKVELDSPDAMMEWLALFRAVIEDRPL
ncbi:hypothetical protein BC830DRAFT_1094545 [Chytriomyces sp. MP71]|nr:hypothetical protein BC830DRAFT_1094545 [Chytriomyces sp. MP71]